RGLKSYISAEHPTTFLFTGNSKEGKDFDSRYSQRGVQWVVKTVCKKAGILKEIHTHTLRHSYATHLLEDGVNILQVQKLLGHERVESTMEYLHVCQLAQQQVHSPLDTVFALCSRTWEVADVLEKVDLSHQNFTVHQQKTLRALTLCRTAALGGHLDACDACGNISISYNSCRNRHCPKCQGHKREEWIAARA